MIVDKDLSDYFLELINKLDGENKLIYAMISFMPHSVYCKLWFKDDSINEIEKEIKNRFEKEVIDIKRDEQIKMLEVTVIRKEVVKIKV